MYEYRARNTSAGCGIIEQTVPELHLPFVLENPKWRPVNLHNTGEF